MELDAQGVLVLVQHRSRSEDEKCPFWLLVSVSGASVALVPPVEHSQHGQGRCGWVWDLKSKSVCLDGIQWLRGMALLEFHVPYLILCTISLILSKPHKRSGKAD